MSAVSYLEPAELDSQQPLCGTLGSTHDGEALNAARLADRFVRDRGLTWPDALRAPRLAADPPRDPWADALRNCSANWDAALCGCSSTSASPKNQAFLLTIAGYDHRPRPGQLEWLHDVCDPYRGKKP